MRNFLLCAWLIFLAGCGPTDKDVISAATQAVSKKLRDPDSARFSDVFVIQTKSEIDRKNATFATCGMVNSKNAFGGYAGSARFTVLQKTKDGKIFSDEADIAATDDSAVIESKANPGKKLTMFEQVYWNTTCVDETHPAL